MKTWDAIIVGAGPAGLAAAQRLVSLGLRDVLVIERESEAGGVPRHCGHPVFGLSEFRRPMSGPAYARRLAARVEGAHLRTGTTMVALAPGGVVHTVGVDGPASIEGRRILLALGARETPRSARLVSGTRPWGVLTTGALQQLVYLAGMRPCARAVIVGSELVSFSALLTLRHAGIAAVCMIEEEARITARRPGDLVARLAFGVPVLTRTRLVAIHGGRTVEAVEIERDGRRERIACDGVVFTGRFQPEAAVIEASHIAIDPGTGGPAIDQHWRCSDPRVFAAGNLLRGIETAAVAWREGRAAADCLAASLRGGIPDPTRCVSIRAAPPLRYVYPQHLSLPGWPPSPLAFKARILREAKGRLSLVADGRELWSRRVHLLPERRISLPASLFAPADAGEILVDFRPHSDPAAAAASRPGTDKKPQSILTERSRQG